MSTATVPAEGDDRVELDEEPGADGGSCGLLGQIEDERVRLMGLVVRTHRFLIDRLGRELEEAVGIPLVFFDVLINVAAAPDGWLTMSRLSSDVALTTGGVTRLIDRMAEAGLVVRENCPSDRRSVHVVMTSEGRDVLQRALEAHLEGIDRHLMDPLDEHDRTALTVALTKVLEGG